jgi:hypothetical protein
LWCLCGCLLRGPSTPFFPQSQVQCLLHNRCSLKVNQHSLLRSSFFIYRSGQKLWHRNNKQHLPDDTERVLQANLFFRPVSNANFPWRLFWFPRQMK